MILALIRRRQPQSPDVHKRRHDTGPADELTIEGLILTRDWVRLRQLQVLAEPLGVIPAGAVGRVIGVGPEAALIRFDRKYPPTYVKFSQLDRSSSFGRCPWLTLISQS